MLSKGALQKEMILSKVISFASLCEPAKLQDEQWAISVNRDTPPVEEQ